MLFGVAAPCVLRSLLQGAEFAGEEEEGGFDGRDAEVVDAP